VVRPNFFLGGGSPRPPPSGCALAVYGQSGKSEIRNRNRESRRPRGGGKPEDEDEEAEKREERGDVVHRSQHDEQLMAQRRQEPNQLQYPQQPERP